MRGKLFSGLVASLLLVFAVVGARAEQVQKVSPNTAGFTIMPIVPGGGDPSGPPTLDPNLRGPLLDPTVPASSGPGAVEVVPEPSTIAMLFLGSGCAGAFTVLRRRRHS